MEALTKYNEQLEKLYSYFGFTPDWVVYPIRDNREDFWRLTDGHVQYAESMERLNSDGDFYEDSIYTQRFYKKHAWEGAEYTMIFVDTHTDGMKYFAIFTNNKKV